MIWQVPRLRALEWWHNNSKTSAQQSQQWHESLGGPGLTSCLEGTWLLCRSYHTQRRRVGLERRHRHGWWQQKEQPAGPLRGLLGAAAARRHGGCGAHCNCSKGGRNSPCRGGRG